MNFLIVMIVCMKKSVCEYDENGRITKHFENKNWSK